MKDVPNPTALSDMPLEEVSELLEANADRVAELGKWPEYKKPYAASSLTSRIPTEGEAAGFDAGIACALDMIPRDKQELAAGLHGDYTPDKVEQLRNELNDLDADSETAWWLAASKICDEGGVDETAFRDQLDSFQNLTTNPKERLKAAISQQVSMISTFETNTYDGVPFGIVDGCMQGAYVAGYPFATTYSDQFGIFFIGTYNDSLGLDDFSWEDPSHGEHMGNSGPVHGSKQFVKCANEAEFNKALAVVKGKFADQMPR